MASSSGHKESEEVAKQRDDQYDKKEEEYYEQKIGELANNKLKLLVCENALAKQLTIELTKKKETISKRPASPSDHQDELDNDQVIMEANSKKKSRAKRPHWPIDQDELTREQVMEPNKRRKAIGKRPCLSTNYQDMESNSKKMKQMKRKMQKELEKRMNSQPPISNEITKRLDEFIRSDEINGSDLTLVIQKLVYLSDLRKDQNRLTMPFNQLKTIKFLKDHEKELLDRECEFDVHLVGPTLKMYKKPMTMKMWQLHSTQSYVLKTEWNNFVSEYEDELKEKNDLIENSIIQVWSFRKDEELCFALAIVEKANTMSLQESTASCS